MNYDGSGNVLPLGYGVYDDEILDAIMEKRERGGKSCWTSTDDEDSGFIWKRHMENVCRV